MDFPKITVLVSDVVYFECECECYFLNNLEMLLIIFFLSFVLSVCLSVCLPISLSLEGQCEPFYSDVLDNDRPEPLFVGQATWSDKRHEPQYNAVVSAWDTKHKSCMKEKYFQYMFLAADPDVCIQDDENTWVTYNVDMCDQGEWCMNERFEVTIVAVVSLTTHFVYFFVMLSLCQCQTQHTNTQHRQSNASLVS